MVKAEPGDIVIVDKEKAKSYDRDFSHLSNRGNCLEMQILDYEFEVMDEHSYVASFCGVSREIPFHIKEQHIIENLSQDDYLCDIHKAELYHEKYEIKFCPFCKIDRETRIKRHPVSRKIKKLWYPHETGEYSDGVMSSWRDETEGILLSTIPVMGLVIGYDSIKWSLDEEHIPPHRNAYWQMAIIGIVIQLIYIIGISYFIWTKIL